MNDRGEFSRLRIGDEGTQRMVGVEDNLGIHGGEGLPSSSLEDVPSRVDAARVIT